MALRRADGSMVTAFGAAADPAEVKEEAKKDYMMSGQGTA